MSETSNIGNDVVIKIFNLIREKLNAIKMHNSKKYK